MFSYKITVCPCHQHCSSSEQQYSYREKDNPETVDDKRLTNSSSQAGRLERRDAMALWNNRYRRSEYWINFFYNFFRLVRAMHTSAEYVQKLYLFHYLSRTSPSKFLPLVSNLPSLHPLLSLAPTVLPSDPTWTIIGLTASQML